jgi:folate-binding protein YgfZ
MPTDVVRLLASGEAFADLSSWRTVEVAGADAVDWLNDLVSADVSGLEPGRAVPSLLLSRTGSIRAAFTVALPSPGGVVLLQDRRQAPIDQLLAPYVLSSDVELRDRSDELSLFALPGRDEPPDDVSVPGTTPSSLGAGVDLLVPVDRHDEVRGGLERSMTVADEEDVERWRVVRGIPRLGVDVLDGDLPQEAGLMGSVSTGKGCYVGQEAVAKMQNLGRPRRSVVPFRARGRVEAEEAVLAGGEDAGAVTSVASIDGDEAHGLARIGRRAIGSDLVTSRGIPLVVPATP